MFKIKRQIYNLLAVSAFGSFQIAGASWVALLAVRGFSMLEIGIAESCFHVASFLFEIPSGVISDVFGRKRSMVLSQCMAILSAVFMMFSNSLVQVCVALMLSALGYNFASGTREALAYDSLLLAGCEEKYMGFSSLEMVIYRVGNASATLCAGFALFIGYRRAYLIDIVLGLVCLGVTLGLKEAAVSEEQFCGTVGSRIKACFRESFCFMRSNLRAEGLMLWNAFVGAMATLLVFFLQAKLSKVGVSRAMLGPCLFFMGLGGAVGSRLAVVLAGWCYKAVSVLCVLGVGIGVLCGLGEFALVMCVGGFAAAMFDDLLQVRSDALLNSMFPSSQRATLISVSSLCFSLVMIVLSPLAGGIF